MRQIIFDFGVLELFGWEIPLRVYGYGLMLVLGLLTSIFLARWRARRMGEDPEIITQAGVIALLAGVIGARAAYVIENWQTLIKAKSSPLVAMLDITAGGLIYYGGLVLATGAVLAYLRWKRVPIRRYVDIVAVSLMVGLAFGRVGCLLNGCCYGGRCEADWPLATEFPMYSQPLVKLDGRSNPFSQGTEEPSPPYSDQLRAGLVAPPEQLAPGGDGGWVLIPPRELHGPLEGDQLGFLDMSDAQRTEAFGKLAGEDGRLDEDAFRAAVDVRKPPLAGSEKWTLARAFDRNGDDALDDKEFLTWLRWRESWLLGMFDVDADGRLDGEQRADANAFLQVDEIVLAERTHAHPLKPAQALGIVNALVIAGVLAGFFRLRRREGQVFALLLMLYPVTRFLLELIRSDNPHDLSKLQLTHNQYTSLATFLIGAGLLAVLQRMAPCAGPTWAERQEAAQPQPAPASNNKRRRRR